MDELVKALRDDNACLSIKTAHEAADAIKELQQTVEHYKGCADDWYKEACEYKAAVPKWIPVTERMPEKSGKFLCNVKQFSQYAGKQYYYVDILVFHEDCFFEDGIGTQRVTHWMPLPEPPKEGDE